MGRGVARPDAGYPARCLAEWPPRVVHAAIWRGRWRVARGRDCRSGPRRAEKQLMDPPSAGRWACRP